MDKAVALIYDEKKGGGPKVAASGQGALAERIIATAREAGVQIVEDPDLIELLAKVPVGEEIPPDLYQAVAEVLAFVYQVNGRFRPEAEESGSAG